MRGWLDYIVLMNSGCVYEPCSWLMVGFLPKFIACGCLFFLFTSNGSLFVVICILFVFGTYIYSFCSRKLSTTHTHLSHSLPSSTYLPSLSNSHSYPPFHPPHHRIPKSPLTHHHLTIPNPPFNSAAVPDPPPDFPPPHPRAPAPPSPTSSLAQT